MVGLAVLKNVTAALGKLAPRRLAGIAGLGYVAGVAIENMEILAAPTLASPVADVRALYEDQALATVTTGAGAVALGFYCLFAVALLGALAIALWIDPTGLSGASPFELPPLGGRFAGSWVALLAVLAWWAALRNRSDEARLSALALVTLPAGALIAALRTLPDLEQAGGYLAAILVLLATGAILLRALKPQVQPPYPRAVNGSPWYLKGGAASSISAAKRSASSLGS
jgi:hypothetical protein